MFDSVLHRIQRIDFFSVFLPGVLITFFVSAYDQGVACYDLVDYAGTISSVIKHNPYSLIFLVFVSYTIGLIVRSISVSFATKIMPPYKSEYPYTSMLMDCLSDLRMNMKSIKCDTSRFPEVTDSFSSMAFNYWKALICMTNHSGYSYYESFEMRTRFASGMGFAGLFGFLSGIYISAVNHQIAYQILIMSLVLYVMYGFILSRVRKQEAMVLLTLYIIFNQEGLVNDRA